MQTEGENLKALQAKFDDIGKIAGSNYCKFWLRSLIKINKRQSALYTDGTIVRWRVELLKYYISETKANSFVEAAVEFVENVSSKEHRGLGSL